MGKTFRRDVDDSNSHHIKAQAKANAKRIYEERRQHPRNVGYQVPNDPRIMTSYEDDDR